ncbi:MAG: sigma-70 family RNA polymerase sigma factor [Sandaracinaceae bacterium]|nr:sigma-70 family RNA polymerase sigma factor [Sandaracinaceae bacterium]
MASRIDDGPMQRYIARVRKIPRLSREEEHDLAVRVRAGDKEAADKLVEANLRFVVAVALQYRRYGIPVGDLLAEGNLGLMMAVDKFDPERGTRFVTYAGYWIRAYVLDRVVRSTTMVGAGSGPLRSKLFFRLRRERAKVASLTSDPSERLRLLAERFETTETKMEGMLRRLDSRDVSLSAPLFDDSGSTLQDSLSEDSEDQETRYVDEERQRLLELHLGDALTGLDDRERYIVEQRYMADDQISLAELGRELGVSRERARQLEARAKKKLKKKLQHLELHAA